MTILWYTEFYPSTEKDKMVGGVQVRCFYVGKEVSRKNKLVVLEGVPKSFANATLLSFALRLLFMPLEIYRGLTTDFDLVEGSNSVMYFPAWLVGKIKKKPVVFWYPDVLLGTWVENFGLVGYIGELIERLNLTLQPDHYIAISNVVKNKLIKKGIPERKISVIYCGIDEEEIKSIKNITKRRDLIAVSRLITYKKIDSLIKTLDPKTSLAIIGWGPEEQKLREMAKEKNVTFLGQIQSHRQVLTEIASSKVLCHPSLVEGFGISIIEAMALGVPVVVPKNEIAMEVTKNGLGVAQSYEILLKDPKLYAQKSREAIKVGRSYSWQKIAMDTENLYENLHKH